MTYARIARGPSLYVAIGIGAVAIAFALRGPRGAAGMGVGLVCSLFGVAVLWYLIGVIGKAMTEGGNPGLGTMLSVLGVFLKIPLYVVGWLAANRLGAPAPGCFLAGLMLVYFGVVAWAMARN